MRARAFVGLSWPWRRAGTSKAVEYPDRSCKSGAAPPSRRPISWVGEQVKVPSGAGKREPVGSAVRIFGTRDLGASVGTKPADADFLPDNKLDKV